MQNLEQVLMLSKALDNWHCQIRAYTQLPHSALGFTPHLETSNKPSSFTILGVDDFASVISQYSPFTS
jgi:hypothetical protein